MLSIGQATPRSRKDQQASGVAIDGVGCLYSLPVLIAEPKMTTSSMYYHHHHHHHRSPCHSVVAAWQRSTITLEYVYEVRRISTRFDSCLCAISYTRFSMNRGCSQCWQPKESAITQRLLLKDVGGRKPEPKAAQRLQSGADGEMMSMADRRCGAQGCS
jgi:hypothetical protein